MSLYNMLFGHNRQADLLLAVIGLKKNDVERLRDVGSSDDGSEITVFTRTGGGNRGDYPNLQMRKMPGWCGSVDDDFDSTYCTDTFSVPEEWRQDVINLQDVIANGLRPEFSKHLSATLNREPTPDDLEAKAYESEARAIAGLNGVKANGHTFVPFDDYSMEQALKMAEDNGGKLRSCWGLLPLIIEAPINRYRVINPRNGDEYVECTRVEIKTEWRIDETYLAHAVTRFSVKYPKAIAEMVDGASRQKGCGVKL